MGRRYAEGTTVSVDRSIAEIRKEVSRFGASEFAQFHSESKAAIGFALEGWQVRFEIALEDDERENRRRWRCLVQTIKSKLITVREGIAEFAEEFMAHLVIGGNQTVGQSVLPQLQQQRDSGALPMRLALPEPTKVEEA